MSFCNSNCSLEHIIVFFSLFGYHSFAANVWSTGNIPGSSGPTTTAKEELLREEGALNRPRSLISWMTLRELLHLLMPQAVQLENWVKSRDYWKKKS